MSEMQPQCDPRIFGSTTAPTYTGFTNSLATGGTANHQTWPELPLSHVRLALSL